MLVTAVPPLASIDARAQQLAEQIGLFVSVLEQQQQHGRPVRVNVIAHSMGGLDARKAAHLIPKKIASITTISSPHQGTELVNPELLPQKLRAGGAAHLSGIGDLSPEAAVVFNKGRFCLLVLSSSTLFLHLLCCRMSSSLANSILFLRWSSGHSFVSSSVYVSASSYGS